MSEQFSILIDSRSRHETGIPGGVWLSMPTTKEQLHAAMESVGITADNPQDFFVGGIANTEEIPFDVPLPVIQNASLDELNYLAKVLEMQRDDDRDKFVAAVTLGEYAGSVKDLINLAQNLDCYWLYPTVQNEEDYGYYLIDELDDLELPEEAKKYFQYEEYGRDAAINEGGRFTEQGYIYNNKNTFTEWYKGKENDIPGEYRVMSFPKPPHRTEPTAYMDAAAPGIMAQAARQPRQSRQAQTGREQPQEGQAKEPRPVIPIVLTSGKPEEKLKEITDRLEQGITELFESDRYKEYLRVMSKFHNYSFNNTLLIAMQKPDATLVKGYKAWQSPDLQRHVKKDEQGIKIIAPSPFKIKQKMEKIDPHTQKPVIGKDGKPVTEEKEITIPAFKVVSVFDVSQTEGKELPTIAVDMLTGDVDRYKDFFAALEKTSPVPIAFENIKGGAHGYYHLEEKRIAIQKDMSELQTLKTAIHEIAHAKLHDIDLKAPKDTQKQLDSRTREVEAESVAYTVCQHYGLDTSDYSFGYVAGWSSGRELAELKGSLETIRGAAAEIINSIDEHIAQLQKSQDKEQTAAQGQPEQEAPAKNNAAPKKQPEQETPAPGKSGAQEAADTPKAAFTPKTIYRARKNPYGDSRENSYLLQAYVTQENGRAKMGDVLYKGTPEKCRELMKQLKSGELTEGDVKELYAKAQAQTGHARITAASRSRYEGMVALYDMDDKIYIGKSENYDNKGNYDNSDNSLLYVSDCQPAFTFLTNEGCTYSQDEALKQGIYTKEDYGEFTRIQDTLSQTGLTPEREFYFSDKPFSPNGDTKALDAGTVTPPDPTISTEDMKQYGYTWDGMLPLQETAALNLFENEDMQIFRLYGDGSENIADSAEDIKSHAEKGGIMGVHKEDWEALREYREMKQELADSVPEKEALLLYGKEDAFGIYQLKDGAATRDLHFEPYDRLQASGSTVDPANYELIYTAPLAPETSLEDIYIRFNTDHPKDFKGHSLSVSDVVVLHQDGENAAHYVDSFGFRDVPEFLQPPTQQKELTPDDLTTGETVKTPRGSFHLTAMSREQMEAAGYGLHHQSDDGKFLIMGNGTRAFAISAEQPENHLKHIEDTVEQNDNSFDGIINNTPTPTARELEARAAAGEQISLAALAGAIRADKERAKEAKPEKKPSIRAQLKADKEKAQKKAAKTKNHDLEV